MATESPMRFVETSGNFGPSSDNMAARELGLLPKDQRFLKNGRNMGPNRSESAPPSIEGSFAAIQNFMSQQKFSLNDSLEDLKLAYHSSYVDLNPRFRIHRIGSLGNDWRLKSFDDTRNDSLHLSESTLSIHEEKSEEDRSPQQARDEWAERKSGYLSEQDSASLGEHKLLVDFLQEDYTRSSSPVYNKFRSFSHDSVEEAFDEADPSSFHDPSISTSNAIISTPGAYDTGLSPKPDSLATHVSGPSPFDRKEGEPAKPPLYRRRSNTKNADLEDQVLSSCVSVSDSTRIESEMKATDNSILPNSDNHKNQREPPQQVLLHQRLAFEVPGAKSQMTSPGISHSYMGTNQFPYGLSNFSSAAYMNSLNPFYHHMHPSSYFSQYGIGGYALNNTGYPPFIPGYPQNAIPMAFDGSTGPSFRAQAYGVSTGEITKNAVDMQHINNFYGQLGFSVKPSLTDPLHHFQQPSADTYNHGVGGPGNINSRRVGPTSPYYFGNPVNSGVLMHFPTSPIATPVLPGSTAGGTHFPRVKTELRLQPGSDRNVGIYSGWQSQRAPESFVDTKSSSFLEELRSGKGRRFELVDIAGQIVEFSADQHGSRFIQQKLENCSGEVKASVFREVLPHASSLITDVFGNYVIQKFFDYGSPEQRKELANKLEGQILPLSLQMYGCRVIQKALEVIELEQKIKLIHELDGHVTSCVRDQNGNHVIQKCIESIPTDQIGFIISAFRGQVATLAMHPYGCRVIQRLLERCTDDLQSQFIVDEILESIYALAQDQYGNYVTQHVLGRGKPHERSQIINKLSGHIGQMSQHKFASNVVEKCLEHSDSASREILIGEIIGHTEENENLLTMMKDQYANYVVQKILETCTNDQREMLLCHISTHLDALKKYTYGKHIAARFEQLYGEEIQTTRP